MSTRSPATVHVESHQSKRLRKDSIEFNLKAVYGLRQLNSSK